mmetsp:Transcript_1338/g.3632  ORF Transcript_1338/g.3632 Transcript_1338/m.3632 type:complete len:207 (-) Transcript_1338:16-636(-)
MSWTRSRTKSTRWQSVSRPSQTSGGWLLTRCFRRWCGRVWLIPCSRTRKPPRSPRSSSRRWPRRTSWQLCSTLQRLMMTCSLRTRRRCTAPLLLPSHWTRWSVRKCRKRLPSTWRRASSLWPRRRWTRSCRVALCSSLRTGLWTCPTARSQRSTGTLLISWSVTCSAKFQLHGAGLWWHQGSEARGLGFSHRVKLGSNASVSGLVF